MGFDVDLFTADLFGHRQLVGDRVGEAILGVEIPAPGSFSLETPTPGAFPLVVPAPGSSRFVLPGDVVPAIGADQFSVRAIDVRPRDVLDPRAWHVITPSQRMSRMPGGPVRDIRSVVVLFDSSRE